MATTSPFATIYSPFDAGKIPGVFVDPDEGQLVTFRYHPAWQGVVVGALKSVVQPQLWDVTPGEMQLQIERAGLLLSLANQANNQNRPFYQSAEEAEDETPPDYPWYEQASDWVIETFIAITFEPEAAIAYRVVIPRLRIAIRSGNVGAVFKILINGLEYMTGDSYAPITGILENNINVEAFAAEHGLGLPPYMLQIVNMGRPSLLAGAAPAELAVYRGDIRPVGEGVTTILRAEPSGCGIQWSINDGASWNTIDLAACISSIADGVAQNDIQQAIDDGRIAVPGSQQSPHPALEPNQCKTYHVQLSANNRWLCPIPVSAGYSIQVSNVTGGWFDGDTYKLNWRCPTGDEYLLGMCLPDTKIVQSGDPADGLYHMQLVGNISAHWFNAYAQFTAPADVSNEPLYFQANDSAIADNQGSIEFDVEICNAGFVHTFDFLTSDGGWSDKGNGSVWQSGTGWRGGAAGGYRDAYIVRDMAATTITSIVVWWNRESVGGANQNDRIGWDLNGSTVNFFDNAAITGSPATRSYAVNHAIDQITIDFNSGNAGSETDIIKVEISGVGVDPF